MTDNAMSLCDNFQRYFSVDLAHAASVRKRVFELRYRVYCEEFGYEDTDAFPDGQESDSYDEHALHCLITHRASGFAAGCVRMVPAATATGGGLLPLEAHCGESLDRAFIEGLALDRNTVCEISRLAVDGMFRRRPGEKNSRYGEVTGLDISQQEQRSFAMISVAAFLAATALTHLSGRTNVFAMMEPFLPRLLAKSGICFERAGEDTDYHGIRAPYFIRTQSALQSMRPELEMLYNAIHGRIASSYTVSVGALLPS